MEIVTWPAVQAVALVRTLWRRGYGSRLAGRRFTGVRTGCPLGARILGALPAAAFLGLTGNKSQCPTYVSARPMRKLEAVV